MSDIPSHQDLLSWAACPSPPQADSDEWPSGVLEWIVESRDGHPVARVRVPWTRRKTDSVPSHVRGKLRGPGGVSVLEVDDGWLVGRDVGEWGGSLLWMSRDGSSTYCISTRDEPICSLIRTPTCVLAVEALVHLGISSGRVLRLRRGSEKKWVAETFSELAQAPDAWAVDHEGLLLVATSDQLVRLRSAHQVDVLIDVAFWKRLRPNSMVVDQNGDILIGMLGGVTRVSKEKGRYSVVWFRPVDDSAERSYVECELKQVIRKQEAARRQDATRKALGIVEDVLAGRIGVLAGWSAISSLRSSLPSTAPVDFLDSVPSDLENLLAAHPTGEARAFWNKEALSRKDQELRQSEERYKAAIESGCRELLRHLRGT